jgi:hypothetical protein
MKTIPEKVLRGIVAQFYRRRDKGEKVQMLIKEIAQVTYSQGYAQGVSDMSKENT